MFNTDISNNSVAIFCCLTIPPIFIIYFNCEISTRIKPCIMDLYVKMMTKLLRFFLMCHPPLMPWPTVQVLIWVHYAYFDREFFEHICNELLLPSALDE